MPPMLCPRAVSLETPPKEAWSVAALYYLFHMRSAAASAYSARGGGTPPAGGARARRPSPQAPKLADGALDWVFAL
eukprot:3780742-Karenia_brevis.AAC.1